MRWLFQGLCPCLNLAPLAFLSGKKRTSAFPSACDLRGPRPWPLARPLFEPPGQSTRLMQRTASPTTVARECVCNVCVVCVLSVCVLCVYCVCCVRVICVWCVSTHIAMWVYSASTTVVCVVCVVYVGCVMWSNVCVLWCVCVLCVICVCG